MKRKVNFLVLCLMGALIATPTWAEDHSNDALAKASQNPVAAMVSVPFQNNLNFNYGPQSSPQNNLFIQPVIPITLSKDWDLIARPIIPVVSQPAFAPGQDSQFGLGDTQLQLFLTPAKPAILPGHTAEFIWGAGVVTQVPTHTDNRLGSHLWGMGPNVVGLRIDGPWVYGALINNVWSLGGNDKTKYNNFLVQPFGNYNFGKTGTYLCSSPLITANWRTGDWVVPLGGGIGQITKVFGNQPVDIQLQAFYNVVHPDNLGPEWSMRFQVKLMFPK